MFSLRSKVGSAVASSVSVTAVFLATVANSVPAVGVSMQIGTDFVSTVVDSEDSFGSALATACGFVVIVVASVATGGFFCSFGEFCTRFVAS